MHEPRTSTIKVFLTSSGLFVISITSHLQHKLKERAEKLEYHKQREQKFMEKKNEKKELLRRQSSVWIDENELEKRILNAIMDES
ncbi:uncharacterized protein LOC110912334 isoform X2 [Helianthus annuus]|uniref:uncharacterized protein LOC110912334 isoform X2 n=1 Tax=Helianthus annuus TaxID=4232 RepID=UPI000B90473E|nr:uncharacterized protein LOC110912334 isoform X2 [Helianthus annuus]